MDTLDEISTVGTSLELSKMIDAWNVERAHYVRVEKMLDNSMEVLMELNKVIVKQCAKESVEVNKLKLTDYNE